MSNASTVRALSRLLADSYTLCDQPSGDLGVRRIELHEKSAWMLRSHLE